MKVLEELAQRFPQLYIKPKEGASQSLLYRGIVRMGQQYRGSLSHFMGSEADRFTVEQTPVGEVMVVFLERREDFICFYQIMAKRCEPVEVPPTMGASFIQGFTDWSRIRAHMDVYEAEGGTDTDGEFARFTANPENYRGALILLTDGCYSAVPGSKTPYQEEEWHRISRDIRKYHELTHFICRRLYPEQKHAVWDELLADCMGLVAAIGNYDVKLAQTFLGIENGRYVGGRLAIYLSEEPDEQTIRLICDAMERLAGCCRALQEQGMEGYALTQALEKDFVDGSYVELNDLCKK